MTVRLLTGGHGGDFWQHAAAVSELAADPLHVRHPQLSVDAPSPFTTPFALLVALPARVLGIGAVAALTAAGLLNLLLLLAGLHRFVHSRSDDAPDAAVTLALLLTLFAWGPEAWLYSGFLHLDALGYVLPYPSTFALGLSLWTLARHRAAPQHTSAFSVLALAGVTALVVLCHPLTFLFLATGLSAQALACRTSRARAVVVTGATVALGVAASTAWPYFPMVDLLAGQSQIFDSSNVEMYEGLLVRAWPTLLLLPLAAWHLRDPPQRSGALMVAGLAVIYVGGAVTGRASFGRVLPALILLVHVAAALALLPWLQRAASWPRLRQGLAATVAVILLALSGAGPVVRTTLRPPAPDPDLGFLARLAGRHDVVMTDLDTGRLIGAFGGKAVSVNAAYPFIADETARAEAVATFFRPEATRDERLQVLERYAVEHVLLERRAEMPWEDIRDVLRRWGHLAHEDAQFMLVSRYGRTRPVRPQRP